MKHANLLITGMAAIALVSVAACSHPRPLANKPADITPVATVSPAPSPTPVKTRSIDPPPATQIAAQPSKQTGMPAADRKRLSDALAKLEDALFDYDQSTIRSDASVALK